MLCAVEHAEGVKEVRAMGTGLGLGLGLGSGFWVQVGVKVENR